MASNTTITPFNSTISNVTFNYTITPMLTTRKPFLVQGQEIIHNSFTKFDRGTLLRASIIMGTITCLILLFIGLKTFLTRKRRQTRRYKLLSSATRMEEPLFNGNDDEEEEEREDDTLFVRK